MIDEKTYDRFMAKVYPEPNSGCWLWMGEIIKGGYGRFLSKGKRHMAHIHSHRFHIGDVPTGLTVDHLCFVTCCVNPQHLSIKTRSANSKRQRSAFKTHCIHGHEFTPANTYTRADGAKRQCRTCARARYKKYLARLREKVLANAV